VAIQLINMIELYLVVKDLLVYLEQHCETDEKLAISYPKYYKDDH